MWTHKDRIHMRWELFPCGRRCVLQDEIIYKCIITEISTKRNTLGQYILLSWWIHHYYSF